MLDDGRIKSTRDMFIGDCLMQMESFQRGARMKPRQDKTDNTRELMEGPIGSGIFHPFSLSFKNLASQNDILFYSSDMKRIENWYCRT